MSLQRPRVTSSHQPGPDVDIPDPDLLDVPSQRDVPEADANRDVVDESIEQMPQELPDDADPADAYEQSVAVVYDEDDYR